MTNKILFLTLMAILCFGKKIEAQKRAYPLSPQISETLEKEVKELKSSLSWGIKAKYFFIIDSSYNQIEITFNYYFDKRSKIAPIVNNSNTFTRVGAKKHSVISKEDLSSDQNSPDELYTYQYGYRIVFNKSGELFSKYRYVGNSN